MVKPAEDDALKSARKSMMWLRVSYIAALIIMAFMSFQIYVEQTENETRIQSMIALSNQFSKISTGFNDAAKRARILTRVFSPDAVDTRIIGMTWDDQDAFYKTAEPEKKIQVARRIQLADLGILFDQVRVLERLWKKAPEEFRTEFAGEEIFRDKENPFEVVKKSTDSQYLRSAKSEANMHFAANMFVERFDDFLKPRINETQSFLKVYLSRFVEQQSQSQKEVLIMSILTLICLALFVFLPVDIILRRLFSKLNVKTQEANKALVKAQAADKAKSEFLATMSHEIRTPMNGVLGMAELLSKTDLDTRQKTFADVIIKSGNALLTIINDILDFSKIEAAQLKLIDAPFNLIESIEDVGALMSSRAAEKNIELILGIDPITPEIVMGDCGRLRQVLTNLIGNAVKFTEVGHVLVRTTCKIEEKANGSDIARIKIEIEDTGIGIPEDRITNVFDKFSQVDGSTTRKHEGTGLGLAISARLVSLMGGTIRVSSRLNYGSNFNFTIELPVEKNVETSENDSLDGVSNARILVIDDNEINRTILTEQLSGWGHECVAVESGPIGIKFLEYSAQQHQAPVDLVVLDFHMPKMNGADVVKTIRSTHGISDTAILILSSVDQAHELEQLSDANVQGHISKPARSKLLRSTINSILRKSKKTSKSASRSPQSESYNEILSQTVDVTANVEPEPQVDVAMTDEIAEARETIQESGLTVLVAEDNPVNQIVFSEALNQINLDFEIANDGREAVALWRKKSPKVIVMDVSMPNMNGHEATREIRRIEEAEGLSHTPIIAVTAHAMKTDEQNCRDAGMDDYMTKPISPEMLNSKVSSWLDRQSGNTAPAKRA
jgi:signal transduction histidine kinase/CheY-like chemotaxis protein